MDYATAALGNAAGQIKQPRPPELGRLKAAAERVGIASNRIDSFLFRFNGPRGESATSAAPQPPESYRNDIDCLFEQISKLEELAICLDSIG